MERDIPATGALEFLILGPFEVRSEGRPLPLRSAKQRALLAILLLHLNEVVSSDRLIAALWPEKPPETVTNLLQVYVSQLRKLLEPARGRGAPEILLTRPPGYMLSVDPARLDSVRFERLVNEGVAALATKDSERASTILEQALVLWRGPALADFVFDEFARAESARLEDLRLLAIEERVEASLARGLHATLVGELEALVTAHPLRDRFGAQLMLALYRSGRQAEALEAYSRTRTRLVEGLGIEPSPALQRLERAILNHDPALDVPQKLEQATSAPAEDAEPPAEAQRAATGQATRRTVTVLFADFVLTPIRSPTIEPEMLEPLFAHLGEALAGIVEKHGGSIHWSSEIEVVAVFGVPRLHEDDALRAVRAAVELRDAMPSLNGRLEHDFGAGVEVRIGVNTGQILVGGAFASPAMGGASSIAARLGRAATDGEILIADATRSLVRDAVTAEPVAPGPIDEHAQAYASWRLRDVSPGAAGVERRLDAPLVGRSPQLAALQRALESVRSERLASLVTLLGPPGIGKSHLAHTFATAVRDECRVLVGGCPAYGEGSTFAPLADIVRQLCGNTPRDRIRAIVGEEPDGEVITERIASAIGLSDTGGETQTTFWAVRKLFESLARERPLVVVLDDLHWAEPTLLDLVEHVVDWTFDAPILLLGLSRPDLLDERPTWAGGRRNTSSVLLEPLTADESESVIDTLVGASELDAKRRAAILEAAGGNPLFLEQLLAMHSSEAAPADGWSMPPTIHALLAARLDRLESEQHAVLDRASIMGNEFWRPALAALTPDESRDTLDTRLGELVRKQLVEPCRPSIPVGDALCFHSGLIREAVYESVPKRLRVDLHERIARWLADALSDRAGQYDEILGYHFESSFRYRTELGPLDESGLAVGREGAHHLASGGRRAFGLGDMTAAAGLLRRAAALVPTGDPARLELLPALGEALQEAGEFGPALAVLDEAIEGATRADDPPLEAKARLIRALTEASSGAGEPDAFLVREAERASEVFRAVGDDAGLATAARMLAWAHGTAGRYEEAAAAAQRAVGHAALAGDERQRARAATQYALAALHGPTPVSEAIDRCREIVAEVGGDRRSEGLVTSILGWLEAMRGNFELARAHASRAKGILVDLGTSVLAAATSQESGQIEMLADEPAGAERDLRRDFEALSDLGETYLLSTVAGDLAQAVYEQGRYDEALELSRVAEALTADDDVTSQAFWRSVRAKVLARDGKLGEALPLAEQAVELLRETDALVTRARTLVDLGEVRAMAARADEARAALEEAVRLLERKGNVIGARQARARLDRLSRPPVGTGV